ncbi:hypothetical protein GJAV_G00083670 [Gymnothorax javanicus]|nr:hypothetical protein GJAV_G00083670 [Gymnothorax javanicus]
MQFEKTSAFDFAIDVISIQYISIIFEEFFFLCQGHIQQGHIELLLPVHTSAQPYVRTGHCLSTSPQKLLRYMLSTLIEGLHFIFCLTNLNNFTILGDLQSLSGGGIHV